MRSRYTAYALGKVDHIVRTTSSDSPHRQADLATWRAELRAWCAAVTFHQLEVLAVERGADPPTVTFWCTLSHGDRDVSFGENSRFVMEECGYHYRDGSRHERPSQRAPGA